MRDRYTVGNPEVGFVDLEVASFREPFEEQVERRAVLDQLVRRGAHK
jgi:hypothetical protein